MNVTKSLSLLGLATGLLLAAHPTQSSAQISVQFGAEPVCPYGYFDYAPYNCAPYGFYGPDWFVGGRFVGAGHWYHGRSGFYGHVDNRYDPHHGYAGPMPERGEQPFNHFHGNEARDPQGHIGNAGHEPGGEHSAGHIGGGGGEHHR